MKKNLMLFLTILITMLITFDIGYSQPPAIQWQKSYGGSADEIPYAVQQTKDLGYIIAGKSSSNNGFVSGNHGSVDCWVVKLNSNGDTVWQKSLGGASADQVSSIKETSDGYILTGLSASNDGDVSGNNGSIDCWVAKLNTSGGLVWQKSYGGSAVDYGVSVALAGDGYVIAATSYSNDKYVGGHHGATTSADYWVLRLNANGDTLWEHSYGGTLSDLVGSIDAVADGYVISGYSTSSDGDVTENNGLADYWIVKLDTAGVIQWQKSYGGTEDDAALAVHPTNDGGYIVAGQSKSTNVDVSGHHGAAGTTDYWVVKLNSSGNLEWQKSYGGTQADNGTSIHQTDDGGYILFGQSFSTDGDVTGHHGTTGFSDYWLVKLDSAGGIVWQKSYGGTADEVNATHMVWETNDGGFILAGGSDSNDGDVTGNNGGKDFWIVKLTGAATDVADNDFTTINKFSLAQNYPNPFNPSTTIRYVLTKSEYVSLIVYNALGQQVSELVAQQMEAGNHSVEWNASGSPSGVYYYRLKAGSYVETKKLVLLR